MTDADSPRWRASDLKVSDSSGYVRPSMNKSPDAVQARKEQALQLFAQGFKPREVARLMGIERSTLYHWQKNDLVYREQKERILAERDQDIAEDLEDIAIRMAKGNADVAKDGLPVWSAVKHMLAVTAPERHGNKVEHKHSGNVFHTLIPTATRLDQLPAGDAPMLDDGAIEVDVVDQEEDE